MLKKAVYNREDFLKLNGLPQRLRIWAEDTELEDYIRVCGAQSFLRRAQSFLRTALFFLLRCARPRYVIVGLDIEKSFAFTPVSFG